MGLAAHMHCSAGLITSLTSAWLLLHEQVFEGRVVRGDPNACGHIIQASGGTGVNRQTINFSTERVVGNGSFGVVFQATCLETGETVRTCCVAAHLFWIGSVRLSRDSRTGPVPTVR